MKERIFAYYENGKKEIFTLTQLQEQFNNDSELAEQKENGTTFTSWLDEMIHMQIYNEIA